MIQANNAFQISVSNTARKIMIFDLLYLIASCILYSMNSFSNKVEAKLLQEKNGGELIERGNADQIVRNYTPCIIL